eukprot:GHVS01028184.1.p1 GENE.GHVS01028184.1~~GHVS01028184.1.p1  ORF type:complete len:252 (+),score=58.18 GHVS01028184.1:59-814(+)
MVTNSYASLKVQALKELLQERTLPTMGKKTELVERLEEYDLSVGAASEPAPMESVEVVEESLGVVDGQAGSIHSATAVAEGTGPDGVCEGSAKSIVAMTEEERAVHRREKFGAVTEADRKLDRAKRFGLDVPELELQKKHQRAQRFGTPVTGGSQTAAKMGSGSQIWAAANAPANTEELERRKKRSERFGVVDEVDKRRKRGERFGTADEGTKLQKRLERFGRSGGPTSGVLVGESAEKLEQRKKRFGLVA